MPTALSARSCSPCAKDATPLTPAESHAFLSELPHWRLHPDGNSIEASFRFKNFTQALALVNQVAELAEAAKHHPDIALGWGYATFRMQTHSIGGLHENDFIIASKISALADGMKELK